MPIPRLAHLSALDLDPVPLAAEATALPEHVWVPHFKRVIYSGDWSGVALRSIGGEVGSIYPDQDLGRDWADTPLLGTCPATAAALTRLDCPLTSVRFLRLGPGASIREHHDPGLGLADGEVRLHIPIVSEERVSFWLAGEPVVMNPGECWYLDLTNPHAASNEGVGPRIHLVVDAIANDWIRDLIGASDRVA